MLIESGHGGLFDLIPRSLLLLPLLPTFHYWLYPVWLCMWQINKNLDGRIFGGHLASYVILYEGLLTPRTITITIKRPHQWPMHYNFVYNECMLQLHLALFLTFFSWTFFFFLKAVPTIFFFCIIIVTAILWISHRIWMIIKTIVSSSMVWTCLYCIFFISIKHWLNWHWADKSKA